jgi:DNA polymerase III epsilon subunit family exonuclease
METVTTLAFIGIIILIYFLYNFHSGSKNQIRYKYPSPEKQSSKSSSQYDLSIDNIDYLPDRFVVVDIETTGLNVYKDKIIEVAAMKVIKGNQSYESKIALIDPGISIPQEITFLTGIDDDMVKGRGQVDTNIIQFIDVFEDLPLVFYNANFDLKFLKMAALKAGKVIDNPSIDVLQEARLAFPGLENYKLSTVADHLGINLTGTHRAIHDCITTLQVFIEAVKITEGQTIKRYAGEKILNNHFRLLDNVYETYSERKDPTIRKLCIENCINHINSIDEILPFLKKEFGKYPHIPTFQYFATILSEEGEFDKAIQVCEKAISLGLSDNTKTGFQGRISRIKKKREKLLLN